MEEGGRAEAVEVRTCRPWPKNSAGACATHARSRRKGEWRATAQAGSGRCEEQAGAISRKCTAADTQSGG